MLNLWQGAWSLGKLPAPLPFTAKFNGLKILGFESKIMKWLSNQDDLSLECMH